MMGAGGGENHIYLHPFLDNIFLMRTGSVLVPVLGYRDGGRPYFGYSLRLYRRNKAAYRDAPLHLLDGVIRHD
jgi:hypothetical protein